jgi:ribonuclease P protein component
MLPRQQRFSLREHPQFFQTSLKSRGSFFTVFYQGNENIIAQAAYVAAKKNFPTAVGRNKVKRQLRALLSPLLSQKKGKVLVVNIYQPITTSEQKKELQEIVQKILQST